MYGHIVRDSVEGRRRPFVLVAMLAALAIGLVLATSAEAAPRAITGGYVDWGIKESFRTYITGPIAHGTITLAGGATQNANGTYRFPAAATGTYDSATGALASAYTGSVHFLGHDGQLDLTVSNIRVQMSGSTNIIVADIVSLPLGGTTPTTYTNVTFVDLNMTGITATPGTNSVAWANIPSTLNPNGVTPFAGFYTAGMAFDPASINLTLAPEGPVVPTNNIITWKVSEQVWTSSSLTPLHEAGNGAVKGTNGFVFPVSSATFNTTTHETHITGSGYLQFGNTAQGNYRVRIANPSIDITAAGVGTVTADVSYKLAAMADFNTPARVVVVNFQAPYAGMTIAGNHASWTYTPDFPLIGDPAFPERRQFPASFLAALDTTLQSHFRQSGSTSDPNKAPAPLAANFDFTPTGGPTGPTPAVQTIRTNVQANGALSISVGGGEVVLPTPLPNAAGDKLVSSGSLNSVTVVDQRLLNPGWNVSGQMSNFTSSAGPLDGKYLGWTPSVVSSSSGQTVTAGGAVAAGVGFTSGASLGSAPAGQGRGSAVLGAGLSFEIPTDTAPAEYSATLTLTVI